MTSPAPSLAPLTTEEEEYYRQGPSDEELQVINDVWFYIVGVASGLLCMLGSVVNCLSLVTWGSREARLNTCSLYFIALSVYDLLFDLALLASLCSADIVDRLTDSSLPFYLFFDPASVFFGPFLAMVSFGSVYTTVALTLDRCLAVSRPFTWPGQCGMKLTLCVQGVVLLWSVLVNVPLTLEGTLDWYHMENENRTFLLFSETDYLYSHFHSKVFLFYLYPAASFVIPVFTILVANVVLVCKVRSNNKAMKKTTSSHSSRARDTTRLTSQVLVISLLTLLSRCLYATEYLWMAVEGTIYIDLCSVPCSVLSAVSKLFLVINASCNFFCYLHFTRTFRRLFVKKFPCFALLLRKCGGRGAESPEAERSARKVRSIFSTSLSGSTLSFSTEPPNGVCLTKCSSTQHQD